MRTRLILAAAVAIGTTGVSAAQTAIGATALNAVLTAQTAQKPPSTQPSPGERGLLGINLYTSGLTLINKFGSPDEIQPIGMGGGAIGAGGGTGSSRGAPTGPAGTGQGAATAGERSLTEFNAPNGLIGDPFGEGSMTTRDLDVQVKGQPTAAGPGVGGSPSGNSGRPGGAGPAGGGSAGGGASDGVTFTRWIYRRGSAMYGFVLDKYMRVVQIEAIGMNDGKVKTQKGVKFGDSFATVIRKYQTPDGYDIAGDSITIRYLVRNKVAFRLQRLAPNKPHVVTGVVVAAGKV